MIDLFGNPIEKEKDSNKTISVKINPMNAVYGFLEGQRCKNCEHLYVKLMGKRYYKCDLRKHSNGPATDHRVNWPACGKFQLIK